VLRDRSACSQSDVVLYNQTNGLRMVLISPVELFDLSISEYLSLLVIRMVSSLDEFGNVMEIFYYDQ
jgi:hypothetical protein